MAFFRFPFRVTCALVLVAGFVSCKQKRTVLTSPPGYNFEKVETKKLDLKIKEISGIVWDGTKNVFIAHADESSTIYYLSRDEKAIVRSYKVAGAGKGDFEDIALVGETPYLLESSGVIWKVEHDSASDAMRGTEVGKLEIEGTNDFESMYYDSSRRALVLICKNCKMDNKSTVSAFAYYLDSAKFNNTPIYRINADTVEKMAPKKTSKLQPSAARIQLNLKKLFIISSAANLLVVADLDGKVESVHWLKPKLFPQPEGLTFNKTGDMYITNEGVTGNATLHRFEPTLDGPARR